MLLLFSLTQYSFHCRKHETPLSFRGTHSFIRHRARTVCQCVNCLGTENTALNKRSVALGDYTRKSGTKHCSPFGGWRGGGAGQRGPTAGILPTVKYVQRAERD